MSARSSMTTLIAEVRQLLQDVNTPYVLDDDTIQGVMDRQSQRILRHRLTPTYADQSDGLVYWWHSLAAHWEDRDSALALKDSSGTELAVSESDLVRGLWKLTTGTSGPVYLHDGYVHDIYAAAVECCKLGIATLRKQKADYNFSTDGVSTSRNQAINTLETLIEQYRHSIRPYALRVAE